MKFYQLANIVGLVGVLLINYLANALPIGGMNTGELSDLYPSLITPVGLTFSIWGVIYILLTIFVIRQSRGFFNNENTPPEYVGKIKWWFGVNCLLNMAWIFAWHYRHVTLSLLIMLGILTSLLIIYQRLGVGKRTEAGRSERYGVWPAFSIYMGWITVATIVNVSVWLIDLGWTGWGLTNEAWAILMLIVSFLIGALILFRRGDLWYNLVLIWAYVGIMIKQMAPPGDFLNIAFIALALAAILFVLNTIVLIRRRGVYR